MKNYWKTCPVYLKCGSIIANMTVAENQRNDACLIKEYAAEGSEWAFRAIVARHVNLVLATAERQVGDRALAEEITQDVFAALAKKAARLSGYETLAGWLYKTTLLEAKAHVRSECRRKAREQVSAELSRIEIEGSSLLEPLAPLLDEGLMQLRESERVALLLRYFEDRSLREIGSELGMREEAARKRVSRALHRLTLFFKTRGFAVSSGSAATVSLLTQSNSMASANLIGKSVGVGMAGWAPASGLSAIPFHLMNLTKIQTAAVCLLLTAVPLLWQERSRHQASVEMVQLQAKTIEQQSALMDLEHESERLRISLQRTGALLATTQARLDQAKNGKVAEPQSTYKWDPDRQALRVPKALIQNFNTINDRKGTIDAQMSEVLQLKPDEKDKLQAIVNQLASDYQKLVAKNLKQVEPRASELFGHKSENTLEFEIGDMRQQLSALNKHLLAQAAEILDPERVKIFEQGMKDWLKIEDDQGWNSGMTILGFAHRCCFYKPSDENPNLMWSASIPGRGMV
ncbi:MAG: polymerase, sigma-24 subunit, subfamily, partial [Verrucomicrobiales bacterium]|nr:polymerase, sigma-24 subunit, subfamily [Verrucomicrobiales bacterium]